MLVNAVERVISPLPRHVHPSVASFSLAHVGNATLHSPRWLQMIDWGRLGHRELGPMVMETQPFHVRPG